MPCPIWSHPYDNQSHIGTDGHLEFEWVTDKFGAAGRERRSNPTWGDLNGDGDLDLLTNLEPTGDPSVHW
ncbi:MAG TPA: hypothetical protein VMO47_10175 [Rhodothermales bacterium]|nr:hypothetical protein [Rhodothermales bacterium]